MGFSLSRSFSQLKNEEQSRIQKRLGVIIGKSERPDVIRKTLQAAFSRLRVRFGHPAASYSEADLTLHRILESFGSLKVSELNQNELEHLRSLPCAVFDEKDGIVHIASEALDVFLEDPLFQKQGYLISHIHGLSMKEKQAWLRWLGHSQVAAGKERLTRILWKAIAHLRKQEYGGIWPYKNDEECNCYLDEYFPDHPAIDHSMPWFYRDLIPFYRAAAEEYSFATEKKLRELLVRIKYGYFVFSAEKPEFGQGLRWRLLKTRERIPGPVSPFPEKDQIAEPDNQEQSLF